MKLSKRGSAAVAISLALALGATGCNRGGDAASGESVTLAVSTLNNPFFVDMRDGAVKAAEAAGIKLEVVDAQNDSATQANQLATAATSGAQGVIINAVDSDAATSAVNPLLKDDVPVVAVDRAVNGAQVDSLVASDNVAGGEQAAQALAEAMGGSGKVIVLQGVVGTSASRERGEGFEKGIAEFADIDVVSKQTANFDRAEALNVTQNLLQANPDVTGIFAQNDEMALGAVQALGDRAGKEVKVVGFDGTADAVKAIQNGKMVATIAQQPADLGKRAVELMAKLLDGESVKETVPVPVTTVTEENAADFAP